MLSDKDWVSFDFAVRPKGAGWDRGQGSTLKPLLTRLCAWGHFAQLSPNCYHHCKILTKYDFLNWENMIKFADVLLVYKTFYGFHHFLTFYGPNN